MKFNRHRHFAREFGMILSDRLPYIDSSTIVISIPTASSRVRRRGFDQSEIIAKTISTNLGLRYHKWLIKISQEDQIGQHRKQRFDQIQKNLKLVPITDLKNTSILLVDDITTTGATLEVAASLLRAGGARHVDAVVVARHLLS